MSATPVVAGSCAAARNARQRHPARAPEPLSLKPHETAVVVVDMQNAYATLGGYVDLAGFDISGAQGTIGAIAKALEAARAAGLLVVYLQNGWDKDYREAAAPARPTGTSRTR